MDRHASDKYLVVTGSSAGGIDALTAFVGGLSADFSATVVVAQHQAPDHHPNRLAEILQARSPLPVVALESQTVLAPGTVYVVSADRDVEVLDGSANVAVRQRKGAKPSIDRLFMTSAVAYGDRLVAVVFSGMGSDGTAGARTVKQHGGTVIVQDAETASFPNMPLAVPPNVVDISARPETMGRMIEELMRLPATPRAASDEGVLRTLLAQLRDHSGIDFAQYKMPTIVRRLSRLMIAANVDTVDEYLRYLQTHPDAYSRTVNSLLINVTEFFRDAELFERLRSTILPRLFEEAKEHGNELRLWSAGTSTGEEAYSLAMLCAELVREHNLDTVVRIFATDVDEQAVTFARRGIYSADALRNVPASLLDRYFVRSGEAYEVSKRIRNMTVFGQHDLAQRAPFPRIDLCLCRNVLIYFTKDLQNRALQLFAFSLRDGGYLIVGKAESTGAAAHYLRVVDSTLKIYQRQGERNLIPPAPLKDAPQPVYAGGRERPPRSAPPPGSHGGRDTGHDVLGAFAMSASIGVVVVDRRYDVVALNGAARTMLELHGVGVGEDLVHQARNVDARSLRAAIDGAFAGEVPVPVELTVVDPADGAERCVLISTAPDRSQPPGNAVRVGVFIIDVTASARRRGELERSLEDNGARLDELSSRLQELGRRQRVLLQANDQLTEANAELRNANEQLLIGAEEAASANEEIETLNEELQATNEELETLNEELQATVEELNTSNDELEERGGDLEQLAGTREQEADALRSQRDVLAIALETTGGSLLIVRGADERIVYASPSLHDRLAQLQPGWSKAAAVVLGGERYALERTQAGNAALAVLQLRAAKA